MQQLIELGYPDKSACITHYGDVITRRKITQWIESLFPVSSSASDPLSPEDLRSRWIKLLVDESLVDWDLFLNSSVRFLSEAKVLGVAFRVEHARHACEHSQSVHKDELEIVKRKLLSVRSSVAPSALSHSSDHERIIEVEVAHQKDLSKAISELEAENTVLERSILVRKDELERALARLKDLRPMVTRPVTPKVTDDQRKQLDLLFREYSSIHRNMCFVEHHLDRVGQEPQSQQLSLN